MIFSCEYTEVMRRVVWAVLFLLVLSGVLFAVYYFFVKPPPAVSYQNTSRAVVVRKFNGGEIEKFAHTIGLFQKPLIRDNNGSALGGTWEKITIVFVDRIGNEEVLKWGEETSGLIDAVSVTLLPDLPAKTLVFDIYVNPEVKNVWDSTLLSQMVSGVFRNRLYEMVYSGDELINVFHRDESLEKILFGLKLR